MLLTKPSFGSQPSKPSEPSKISKSRKPETSPFVLEDEDGEPKPDLISADHSASFNASITLSQSRVLHEISPNTSQYKVDTGAETKKSERDADATDVACADKGMLLAQRSPRRSPSKENGLPPVQTSHKLREDLAEVIKRQGASSSSHPAAPAKRKSRPLGRNLSSISNRSGSIAAAPSIAPDAFEENSAADGYAYANVAPALPPSTQLGYDTPEAEAHRQQVSKKMGTSMLEDEGMGKRVASVGTVKDSGSRSAVGGRVKGRLRTKT